MTTKRKRRKHRLVTMRFRKGDATHNLLAAVQHWVKANGGNLLVVGGIGIMPDGDPFSKLSDHKFSVVVGCLGVRPKKRESP